MFDEQGRQIFRGQEALNRFAEALGSRLRESHKLHYKTTFQNLPISIENRKGSVRRGTDDDGEEWETKMKHPYGYIRGTEGPDGDAVDVFVGPNEDAAYAYVIHSNNPETGEFDEDKVMLGFNSSKRAKEVFMQHYDDPKFFGGIDRIPMWKFSEKVFVKKHTLKKLVASMRESSRSIPAGVGATGLDQSMKRAMLGNHQPQMINPEVREAREPAFASLQLPQGMLEKLIKSGQAPPIRDASKGGIREGGPGSGPHKEGGTSREQIQNQAKQRHTEIAKVLKDYGFKKAPSNQQGQNSVRYNLENKKWKLSITVDTQSNGYASMHWRLPSGRGGAFSYNVKEKTLRTPSAVEKFLLDNYQLKRMKASRVFESRLGSFLQESRRSPGTYYARELARYDTDAEEADVDLIQESFGGRVDFPRTRRHGQLGMGYFHEKIDRARRVVIKPARGKKLTAGVFSEAKHAIKKGIPVYGIHKGKLRRVKNVEALGHPNKEGHFGRVIYRKRRH